MQIANPIYDVVFKYLMEDGKVAKLLISSIIGEKISSLSFLPKDFVTDLDKPNAKKKHRHSKTVYQLDFSAKIKTEEGEKQILIEIQKAKFAADIMRFRRYLGEQYSDKENMQVVKIKNRNRKVGVPIISIYFLGHRLSYAKASVIGIKRTYTDIITGEIITTKEAFIESLTHDSFVIQIPELAKKRRNELEILLSIFDQTNAVDNENHILNIKEEDFPEKYRVIIRKLQAAISDADIKKKMILEDGILDEMEDMDREIEELTEENEQIKLQLDNIKQEIGRAEIRAQLEKEHAEQEKIRALHEKEQAEQEKIRALHEKEQAEQEKIRAQVEKEQAEQEKIRALLEKERAEQEQQRMADKYEKIKKRMEELENQDKKAK